MNMQPTLFDQQLPLCVSPCRGENQRAMPLVHVAENNPESQEHLQANRAKFSAQCELVLYLLNSGVRLTRRGAYDYGIASLERRVKDLRENGVVIQTAWVEVNGRKSHKEYFIAQP